MHWKTGMFLLGFIIFGALPGRAVRNELEPKARDRLKKMTSDYRAGGYDRVIESSNVILNLENAPEIYHLRGIAYAAKKQYVPAIRDLRKASELDPENAVYTSDLATAYLQGGDWDQALTYSLKAVSVAPKDKTAYVRLGDCYLRQKEIGKALSNYEKALAVDPQYADAYEAFGNFYLKNGNADLAIQYYSKAIEVDPENPFLSRLYASRKRAYTRKFFPSQSA